MKEKEWLECTDPRPMLIFLRGKATDRKLRLFACACCQRWSGFADDLPLQEAVSLMERYADGLLPADEFPQYDPRTHHRLILEVTHKMASEAALNCAFDTAIRNRRRAAFQAILLRCVVGNPFSGNPFRPVKLNPDWFAWNDGTVRKIAQAIYEERAFDRLPILADALTEAGCDNADILNHCRSEGPHVKGCWVVDLVLGKE